MCHWRAAIAPLFALPRRTASLAIAALVLLAGATANAVIIRKIHQKRGGADEMRRMVAAIQPRLTNCLYVWDGSPLLYHYTGSCLPTRYPFAGHLTLKRENGAIGVDQMSEVRRILAGKPSVIEDHEPIARDFQRPGRGACEGRAAQSLRVGGQFCSRARAWWSMHVVQESESLLDTPFGPRPLRCGSSQRHFSQDHRYDVFRRRWNRFEQNRPLKTSRGP